MMTCKETRRLQARFFAMELAAEQEAEVRDHLETCRECRRAYANAEPSFAFAAALRRTNASDEGATFVSEVMAGVRQRRSEQAVAPHRRRLPLSLAAAAVLTLAAGLLLVRGPMGPDEQRAAVDGAAASAAVEPALVEVEGEGVRIYQLASDGEGAVQVAFIVDPQMEL